MNSMQNRDAPVADDEGGEDAFSGSILNERQERILKIAVVVMGAMLLAGFALLIGLVALRATRAKPPAPIVPAGVAVPYAGGAIEAVMPNGARWLASSIDGNRLAITLETPDKNLRLLFFDLDSGQVTGSLLLKQGEGQ